VQRGGPLGHVQVIGTINTGADRGIARALAEATEYYGVLERFVPVARELFRMLKELYPSAGLAELNQHALRWCREVYGAKEHGTTRIAPMGAFQEEREKLKPLPAERFQVPVCKPVSVHAGDQFLTFDKKRFSLPAAWKGRSVWARYAAPLLQLYHDERLIRQYVVNGSQRIYWVPEDFPAEVREMMNGAILPGSSRRGVSTARAPWSC
jgi:hypothetical protein